MPSSLELGTQRAKKVVTDSPGLVDFAIGLVNPVLNLPDGKVKIFRRSKITEVLRTSVARFQCCFFFFLKKCFSKL